MDNMNFKTFLLEDKINKVEVPEDIAFIAFNKNRKIIEYISNPTEPFQLKSVKYSGFLIQHIEDPSEEVQLAAVKQNGGAIQNIKDPSEEVQLISVKEYGDYIKYIKNPTEKVKRLAIEVRRR